MTGDIRSIVFMICFSMFLTACGQYGKLYLPNNNTPTLSNTSQDQPINNVE